jgi:hypothetical protein
MLVAQDIKSWPLQIETLEIDMNKPPYACQAVCKSDKQLTRPSLETHAKQRNDTFKVGPFKLKRLKWI